MQCNNILLILGIIHPNLSLKPQKLISNQVVKMLLHFKRGFCCQPKHLIHP